MIIKSIEIKKFRAFENVSFNLGKRITAISGRNATQKTTLLGMLGQPFTISSKDHPMYGCKTIDGYNFRSQFKDKFKISPEHDAIGAHEWRLNLYKSNAYEHDYYTVKSIARKQAGREPSLRFWNAERRTRGAGYIQLPVYFLSLSRLFPIGETGKTQAVHTSLTKDELEYCIDNYRTILSIQQVSGTPYVGIEKGSSSKIFAGVSDDVHDIFTNSAGEGNITRIILAILSFRRLKKQYGKDYKGGILLIDELDATLYGFSQTKLVEYLWNAADECKIQIIFTTHSPIILKCVNKFMRKERQRRKGDLPTSAYDSSIVYLEPEYDSVGNRNIHAKNICTSDELSLALNDINLDIHTVRNKINVYCEDARAISFLKYVLEDALETRLDSYISFVDVNLGWTNYVQLAEKKVPEFINNIIVLDGDVLQKDAYEKKKEAINTAGNFLFLPLVIEKSIFEFLKDTCNYSKFKTFIPESTAFTYDVCFNNWPLETKKYNTDDFKYWFSHAEQAIGETTLFRFWCNEHKDDISKFVDQFVFLFNLLAERNDFDFLPLRQE